MIVVRSRITSRAPPDLRLRRGVDGRRRVVEDEDARVDQERTGDRDALSLAARERDPALADDGLVAVRELLDELVCLRGARRRLDRLVRRVRHPERDVVAHDAEKRNGSCEITPISRRSERRTRSRTSIPSTRTRPAVAS